MPQASYSENSSIKFDSKEIINASKQDLLSLRGNIISMVFQEPMTSLNPYHKVGNQITESVLLHSKVSKKEAKDEALNLMKLVEITMLKEDLIHILTSFLAVKDKEL